MFGSDGISRVILHSDLNNFYASVECLYHPELRDKPVVVGGDAEARHGIVLAKNQLAKACGIKTGLVLWQAKQLCPNLVILKPNFSLYLRFSKMVRDIYLQYTDQVEAFGIDECWLDVSGSVGLFGSGEKIAEEIRQRIKTELGVTVSIGVSFNKIFAKLGSDMKKPDAVTVINDYDFRDKIWMLPASDLLYVGRATSKKLQTYGIHTIGQLATAPLNFLSNRFGKWGEVLWCFANGHDTSPVGSFFGEESLIKSIGNSTTTPRDLINNEDIKIIVYVLSESISARMREHGFKCCTVALYVRDVELFSFLKQTKLTLPSNLCSEIAPRLMDLFLANYKWQKPIRSIGVKGTDFIADSEPVQLDLSGNELKRDRELSLEKTVDVLRKRFGNYAVQRGLMFQDRGLSKINPKGDNVIHPVSYF